MGGALAAILTRMVRTAMLEELGQDYIRTARAKGLPERTVVYKHALRNAMIPVLTVIGLLGLVRVSRESGSTRGGDFQEIFDAVRHVVRRLVRRPAPAVEAR